MLEEARVRERPRRISTGLGDVCTVQIWFEGLIARGEAWG